MPSLPPPVPFGYPGLVVLDAAPWVVRLRAAAGEVGEVSAALRRRAGSAGLAGPAGEALATLVADVARLADELAAGCGSAADAVARQAGA
ncbi:hypothetical protein ACPPVT_04795 [Angustibacter sp. McL0619]|uniref:hypothetical protein n=1 Tax=Angustibacter sp. McL0619 TaxID=3415676 RepID=UPI003CE923F6